MTSQIHMPAGQSLLAELQEFGTFSATEQNYIRRSLDIAFGGGEPFERWSRSDDDTAGILAQMRAYAALDWIWCPAAEETAFSAAEAFAPLLLMAQFDIRKGRLTSFSAFRFLYERLMGGAARPWLPSAFCAVAAMPDTDTELRAVLLGSLGDALSTKWSSAEASFYPEWIDCLTVEEEILTGARTAR